MATEYQDTLPIEDHLKWFQEARLKREASAFIKKMSFAVICKTLENWTLVPETK